MTIPYIMLLLLVQEQFSKESRFPLAMYCFHSKAAVTIFMFMRMIYLCYKV